MDGTGAGLGLGRLLDRMDSFFSSALVSVSFFRLFFTFVFLPLY